MEDINKTVFKYKGKLYGYMQQGITNPTLVSIKKLAYMID
jgi:hypothetical protein